MGKTYVFPSPEDRQVVQTAVQVFLTTQSGRARDMMLKTARAVLDRYGISRLKLYGFTVEATREPGWVVVRGTELLPQSQRHCPGCGADIYRWPGDVRILSIREGYSRDLVTYGCRCGKVFSKAEPV